MVFERCVHDAYACWSEIDRPNNSPHACELPPLGQGYLEATTSDSVTPGSVSNILSYPLPPPDPPPMMCGMPFSTRI